MKAIVTTVSAMLVAFAIQAQEPKKAAPAKAAPTKNAAAPAAKSEVPTGTIEPGKPAKPTPEPSPANPNAQTQPTKPVEQTAPATSETPKK
jgi:hypothetical protein